MTPAEFNLSVSATERPRAGLSTALCALWWMAKGDWGRAHTLAQGDASAAGSWVQAHLPRVEGDEGNAGYMACSRGPAACGALEVEREAIVAALLEQA